MIRFSLRSISKPLHYLDACLRWFVWNLLSDRTRLGIELRLSNQPFVPPSSAPAPTILEDTRCELERLRNVELSGYSPGLSENARSIVERTLRSLVKEGSYRAKFPMASLHGCSSSKARHRPDRAACSTMAALGALIDDLKDLDGKREGEIVSACLEWRELRLDQGIRLTTDDWHKRFYWSNSGGSHHMAVLCYELQRQEKLWCPEVEIKEFSLNIEALEQVSDTASLFVVTPRPGCYGLDKVFQPMSYRRNFSELRSRLGIELFPLRLGLGILSRYDLVVIDHSKKYASLSLKRLTEAVGAGFAMTLQDFLTSCKDPMAENTTQSVNQPAFRITS